eukprot:5432328-Pyramimonas_sp.AAC.1
MSTQQRPRGGFLREQRKSERLRCESDFTFSFSIWSRVGDESLKPHLTFLYISRAQNNLFFSHVSR